MSDGPGIEGWPCGCADIGHVPERLVPQRRLLMSVSSRRFGDGYVFCVRSIFSSIPTVGGRFGFI